MNDSFKPEDFNSMRDVTWFKSGDRFGLGYRTVHDFGDGSIGTGSAQVCEAYNTETERMQGCQVRELKWEVKQLNSELAYLKTTRGANENLRRVRAARRAKKK